MLRRFKISVDGRAYDVVVEEIGADGATHPVAGVHPVAVAAAPAFATAPAASPGDEVAPLAGVVIALDVGIGESVEAGARIATIEAMKMKTEVFAKGAGKVAAIAARVGESVDTGGVLLTLA